MILDCKLDAIVGLNSELSNLGLCVFCICKEGCRWIFGENTAAIIGSCTLQSISHFFLNIRLDSSIQSLQSDRPSDCVLAKEM